jgi:hypothetical protein
MVMSDHPIRPAGEVGGATTRLAMIVVATDADSGIR